jgi:tetratricopeptide (TPR) repeat protein
MHRFPSFFTTVLVGVTIAFVQPLTLAESGLVLYVVVRDVTVKIQLQRSQTVGSGVIINRVPSLLRDGQGYIYTLVTNKHVVCGKSRCTQLPIGESYELGLADDQYYRVKRSSIKLLGNDLDLAIIQFRSNRNYPVAKIAQSESLKVNDKVYTSGFPLEESGFDFNEGKVLAAVNKRLIADGGGYTVVYNSPTQPGMSGGGVFNSNGQLVAIHGQGDRFRENTEIDDRSKVNQKIGVNRGIPVRWLLAGLGKLTPPANVEAENMYQQSPTSADEYFIIGFNKFIEPGTNVRDGKQQAIQNFSRAIQLNSKYEYAYAMRAYLYQQIQDFQQSLNDYNKVILLNPQDPLTLMSRGILKRDKLNDGQGALADFNRAIDLNILGFKDLPIAHYNRGILKRDKLNDGQGALADFNRAININIKFTEAYYDRALLKSDKLNDIQGAVADYNQVIVLSPTYSTAYYNRAILKAHKLNDLQGAIKDFRQAAKLFQKQGRTAYYQLAIQALKQLGTTE